VGLREHGVRPAVAARWQTIGRMFVIGAWMWLKTGMYAAHQSMQEGRMRIMSLLRIQFPCVKNESVEVLVLGLEMASGRALYRRLGVGLLTMFCKRPHPRSPILA
jgi:hypothetical protein